MVLLGVGRRGLGPLGGIGSMSGPVPPRGGTERYCTLYMTYALLHSYAVGSSVRVVIRG